MAGEQRGVQGRFVRVDAGGRQPRAGGQHEIAQGGAHGRYTVVASFSFSAW